MAWAPAIRPACGPRGPPHRRSASFVRAADACPRTSARSLSPRPEQHTMSTSESAGWSAWCRAWAVSSAGMIPSRRVTRRNVSSASASVTVEVGRAADVAQMRVLGAAAGVVQAGRDRVGLEDLAHLVLQHGRQRSVQHAGTPGDGERRAVAAGLERLAAGLDADERDALVAHEGREDADRVGAAADAGDDAVGQATLALEDLRARLVADHPLQVAHERRVGRRADRRADDVVRGVDVGDPVADRLRRRLLERARAGLDRRHGRAQQLHALDVGRLAADVLHAHVDDALEVHQRARRRRGDAVLARAGLGDDAPLAHAPGQQRLADGVVDLVRAGVVEVLALEVQAPAGDLAEAVGEVQRRRAPDEVAQQAVELGAEAGVAPGRDPRLLELGQRRHERLGHVLAAVGAEAMFDGAHGEGHLRGASRVGGTGS